MRNRFRTLLALAAAVLLASCSQDEVMTDTGHDGLVPVTLSAAVGDGVQTRAVDTDDDEDATYCYVQVCDAQGNAYTDNDYATPTRLTDEDKDGIFTGNIYLKPNESHVFLFWADNATSDIPADLHNVTYQKESIAFADRVEKTIGSVAPMVNATLQHVVAKVTLKTTTDVEAGSKISVTVPTTYTTYNVNAYRSDATASTNLPVGGAVTNELFSPKPEGEPLSAITGTEEGTVVFSFYALVKDETQNITLANGTNSQQVTNVPLGPNMHTTLVGDVQNIGLTDVTFTASIDGKWDDTATEIIGLEIADGGTRYIVSSPAALEAWATEMKNDPTQNLNCTLAADIDLTGTEWTPIPNFAGTFDGNGKTITGLTINQSATDNLGLFASIDDVGTVKNLKLDKVNVTAKSNAGAIAGVNRGTIENCSVSGSVTGSSNNSYVGGIAGFHRKGSITDCHSSATVEGKVYVGGIAGQNDAMLGSASIIACYSTGSVTATINSNFYSYAGGVVGLNSNGAVLTACYATGDVKGDGAYVGGVVGDNVASIVNACYHATGSVAGASGSTGGVAGRNYKDDYGSGILNACYWDGTVTGDTGIGYDMTGNSASEALKVSGRTTWTEAMGHMNSVLTSAGTGWQYATGSGDIPLTLQRQN